MWNNLTTFLHQSFSNHAKHRKLDLRARLFGIQQLDRHDALRHDIIHRIYVLNGSHITVRGLMS